MLIKNNYNWLDSKKCMYIYVEIMNCCVTDKLQQNDQWVGSITDFYRYLL